ncbi:hypothetical protein D3C71_1946540 [compost metagenome]
MRHAGGHLAEHLIQLIADGIVVDGLGAGVAASGLGSCLQSNGLADVRHDVVAVILGCQNPGEVINARDTQVKLLILLGR